MARKLAIRNSAGEYDKVEDHAEIIAYLNTKYTLQFRSEAGRWYTVEAYEDTIEYLLAHELRGCQFRFVGRKPECVKKCLVLAEVVPVTPIESFPGGHSIRGYKAA